MALADKDILITPNIGQTADPKIEFKGADATLGPQTISLNVYPTSNGTLSFEGSAGQLFSITNDLTGSIFSVNDISGIPSIEVNADGTVKIAEFSGNVGIGTSSPAHKLSVVGAGNFTDTVTAPTFIGALSGNATTATTLQTARAINGVNFNGSAAITITANTTNALTIGTGLSGTSFNGSGAVTVAIDSTVATLTGTQTLTNKTLTSPRVGTGIFDSNGAEVLNIVPVASAVNELSISNAATGGNVLLSTAGSDANINLLIQTKGTGAITLDTGTGAGQIDLKAGASNVRVWDDDSSHYYQFVTGNRTANYNINLPVGDVTLTAGTSVVTTRNIATTAPLAGGGNLSANRTLSLAAGYGDTQNPYASKTANFVLAAPTGTDGVPTFRAIVADDIPTLNQSTTGNAGTATTLQTARAINGVNFNGSAAITVPGNFANRTTNESGHAVFISTTATGNQSMFTNANYRFNPSTAELSATNFNSTSDQNKKKDIETIVDPLTTVKNLRGVTFNWKDTGRPGLGVIAQEVEQHLPQVVVESDDGSKTVQYGNIVGLLIESIKEQQAQIEQLTKIIESIQNKQ